MKLGVGMVLTGVFMASASAAVPTQIAHQGVVAVNGNRFSSNGTFYFALVANGGAGNNLWTNDGTQLGTTNRPTAGATIAVANGVYSANLGGGTMTPIDPSAFNNANVVLRIWFDDGTNGVQQMSDQVLSTTPYAAKSAFEPPIGTILAWHKNAGGVPPLPDGWVECNGQFTVDDPSTPVNEIAVPNLNIAIDGYSGGYFLRGGTVSGTGQHATQVAFPQDDTRLFMLDIGTPNAAPNSDRTDVYLPIQLNAVIANAGTNIGGTWGFASTRPVNMSVVWIMRVK